MNCVLEHEKIVFFPTTAATRHSNVREKKICSYFPCSIRILGEKLLEYVECPLHYWFRRLTRWITCKKVRKLQFFPLRHHGVTGMFEKKSFSYFLCSTEFQENFGRKIIRILEMPTVLLISQAYTMNYMRKKWENCIFLQHDSALLFQN